MEAKADLEIESLELLTLDLMEKIRSLEPFGMGNPEPVFLLKNMEIRKINKMGTEEQHMRMILRDDRGCEFKIIAFNASEEWLRLEEGMRRDIWVNLVENEWQNYKSVEGRILQIK